MASKRPARSIPAERLARYERLVATQPHLERKGATVPYTSVNGNMFSFLSDTGTLALRLSADDRAAFIERYGAHLHEAHGTTMKEYVTVPEALAADESALVAWFAASHAYVAGLKPKATKQTR
jgi:hypothetical protein